MLTPRLTLVAASVLIVGAWVLWIYALVSR